MPSPVTHSLIGIILGLARYLPRGGGIRRLGSRIWRLRGVLLVCVILANAPDIDYLFGLAAGDLNLHHQLITHTLGWITLTATMLWWAQRYYSPAAVRFSFGFIFLLLASHLVMDYFGTDNSYPYGIMLFWPFTERFYITPHPIFLAPVKGTVSELWSIHNFRVMATELLILLPLLAGVLIWKLASASDDVD